jgi:hypothetical protein
VFYVSNFGIHKPAYNPAYGEGFEDAFRNFDIANPTSVIDLGLEIGEKFPYENGIYQVVRVRGGGAKGDWVKLFFGGATRLGTVANAPAPTKAKVNTSFNLVGGDLVNPSKGIPSWAFITSGTGIGQRRRIIGNTDSSDATNPNILTTAGIHPEDVVYTDITSNNAWGTTPANGDGLSIICPWEATKTAAAFDLPQGVLMGDVTDGQYGVICVAGLALAKCVGSTDALVAGQPIVISGTAGAAKGRIAVPGSATVAMQEAGAQCGYAIDAYSGASALRHVWVSGQYAM